MEAGNYCPHFSERVLPFSTGQILNPSQMVPTPEWEGENWDSTLFDLECWGGHV